MYPVTLENRVSSVLKTRSEIHNAKGAVRTEQFHINNNWLNAFVQNMNHVPLVEFNVPLVFWDIAIYPANTHSSRAVEIHEFFTF